jgi:hypothetical protein
LDDARERLPLPGEPARLRAETRALLEESPAEGARLVEDATFVADPLWEEWGEILERSGMDKARFLEIARSYSAELRLWVVGERPWIHCVSGLAGRVRRRLPAPDGAASRR